MATSVQIELTDDNGSNESLIFETLKNSGIVKCLSFHSNSFGLRPDFTTACSMSAAFSLLPHLRSIVFDTLNIGDWSTDLMESTTQNHKLELHVRNCEISESAASALRYALQTNRIKLLDLGSCSFSTEGIQEISSGLRNTENLVTLYLSDLHSHLSPGLRCPLSTLIQDVCLMIRRKNTALTDLQLTGMDLGDDGLSLITRAIERHQTLMSLDVWSNTFGALGIMNLMSMIRLVPTLCEVNFTCCDLSSEALAILATCLAGNKTVHKLDLTKNEIDDASAILFGTLLHGNEVLKILEVGECNLTPAGFTSIMAGLALNVALDEFSAYENPRVDNSALETYLELVRTNKGPAEVHLKITNHISLVNDDLAADFALVLQRNTKLRHFTFGMVSLTGLRSIPMVLLT